ncbi:hypothetical protein [Trichocoleus sp. FACHB-262]|uniref:hypothetical protein n=1 Tax=Trichocoleus sp. FACHB-262 TaxID=2692869 RepID=UPI0016842D7C|nr:hypothetical protein [Trichocoleus sp. FACHB-262]MBD2124560.1 hypothetical protein [Trichocoleus sp. FACHB-262]
MVSHALTQQGLQVSDECDRDCTEARKFWAALDWEFFCFPERYPDLIQQHREASLDPRDEQYLNAAPLGSYQRPTTFTSRNGRTVCID